MARAFGNLCRELFGSHLFIKGKLVIDSNCNVVNIDTVTAANVCVTQNLIVKGNVDIVGNLLVPDILGNVCAQKVNVGCISEKSVDSGIIIVGNTLHQDAICVDLIKEFTPGNGVCIGEASGEHLIVTTVNNDEPAQNVTGDAAWQSFVVGEKIILNKINVDMTRTPAFVNAAMQARLYVGVSTSAPDLIGTITLGAYNGGDIDFSSLGLLLNPGTYTLQMDYPFAPPNNPINYIWNGHTAINGVDPEGSASNITLHLTIYALSKGGIKVGSFFTCVRNKLKLEFCEANCNVIVSNVHTDGGMYDNGFLDIILDCAGGQSSRELSFDGNVVGNLCINTLHTSEINEKTAQGNINVNGNVNFGGNIVTVQHVLDANCTINRHSVHLQNTNVDPFVTLALTPLPIAWQVAAYDPDQMFPPEGPEIVYIVKSGVYHITTQINLHPILSGVVHYFAIQSSQDGGATWTDCAKAIGDSPSLDVLPPPFTTTSSNLSCEVALEAGDYVRVVVAADVQTNQSLNDPIGSTPDITYVAVRYVHE